VYLAFQQADHRRQAEREDQGVSQPRRKLPQQRRPPARRRAQDEQQHQAGGKFLAEQQRLTHRFDQVGKDKGQIDIKLKHHQQREYSPHHQRRDDPAHPPGQPVKLRLPGCCQIARSAQHQHQGDGTQGQPPGDHVAIRKRGEHAGQRQQPGDQRDR
jgi:hypothetical protein